ncbi:hypothetical protein D3C72_2155780 [compost metagenome]
MRNIGATIVSAGPTGIENYSGCFLLNGDDMMQGCIRFQEVHVTLEMVIGLNIVIQDVLPDFGILFIPRCMRDTLENSANRWIFRRFDDPDERVRIIPPMPTMGVTRMAELCDQILFLLPA